MFMSKKTRRIKNLEVMVRHRDEKLKHLQTLFDFQDQLLEQSWENEDKLREKIKDLENNVEFLTNNLSAQKKKLLGL